ncbi:OprO/OprP family phosphate-selective porin [Thermodesulfobacteriota bacterium]
MKGRKYLAMVLFGALCLPAVSQAEPPTNQELYDMILELKQELQASKEEAAAAKKELAEIKGEAEWDENKGLGPDAVSMDTKVQKSYLTWESADGNFQYKIDGRIQLDTGVVDSSKNSLYTNTEFRRIRLGIKARMYKDWNGEFDIDFADEEVDFKDMWISYNGFPNTIIKLGNSKPNFSMDEVTTSRWITFMERSMISDAFSPGRRIGLSGTNWGKYYFAGVSLFGDEVDADNEYGEVTKQAEPFNYSVRLVGRPIVADDNSKIVHVGFNYMNTKPAKSKQADDEFRYRTRSEAHFVDYRFLEQEDLNFVDDATTYGLELAAKWNKLHAQAEYMKSTINRSGGNPDADADGWYVQASYFLTDDQRVYNLNDGEFGAVMPKGKWGAFEVAARFSTIDLNDTSVWGNNPDDNGGSADAITFALNWYINNNFMIKANYLMVDHDENANDKGNLAGDDDLDIFGMRFQYLF